MSLCAGLTRFPPFRFFRPPEPPLRRRIAPFRSGPPGACLPAPLRDWPDQGLRLFSPFPLWSFLKYAAPEFSRRWLWQPRRRPFAGELSEGFPARWRGCKYPPPAREGLPCWPRLSIPVRERNRLFRREGQFLFFRQSRIFLPIPGFFSRPAP